MRKYLITISDLEGHNLPKKDIFNKSDTYLIIYWPNTKPVRTSIVYKNSDPVWDGFQHSLEYVLEDKISDAEGIQRFLKQQLLRIECYAKHSLRKDSIIGTAQVDLLMCLGGPTDHKITLLSDRHQDAGSLNFKITARCIGTASISLHDVTCHLNEGEKKQHLYLRSFLSSNNNTELETSICFHTCHPYWASVGPFEITGDLQMVMNSTLTVHLFAKDAEIVRMKGIVNISLGKYNTASQEYIFFREPVVEQYKQSQNSLGVLEGYIAFSDLPVPCQMWKGYHKDNKIYGAAPLTTGLFTFPELNVDKLPPVYDLYHSGHLIENDRLPNDGERQAQLREIIERINCDEDISSALADLLSQFNENQSVLQEAFYQVGGVSVMISLLQNSLDMLPLTLPTAGANPLDSAKGILSSIAEILFLALENYQKNQGFLCRSNRMNLLLRFLERTVDKKAIKYLLLVVTMIASRDLSGQQSVVDCGGIPIVSKILLHEREEEIIIECINALAAMAFGIHQSVKSTSNLIRNTGALSYICSLVGSNNPLSTQQAALASLQVICNNNSPLQVEFLEKMLSFVSEWEQFIERGLWDTFIDLITSWLSFSSSESFSISNESLSSLFSVLQQETVPETAVSSTEDLICCILQNKPNPKFSRVLDISTCHNVSRAIRFLSRISHIYSHTDILSINLQILLFHFDNSQNQEIQQEILDLFAAFGTSNLEASFILFPVYLQFLYNEDQSIVLQTLTSFEKLIQQHKELLFKGTEFQYCVQRICDIFISPNRTPDIAKSSEDILTEIIRHNGFFGIFPTIKAGLSHQDLEIVHHSTQLLHKITLCHRKSKDLQITVLHSLEHILPSQIILPDNPLINDIKQEYLHILAILGAKNAFRQQVFSLWPSIYFHADFQSNTTKTIQLEKTDVNLLAKPLFVFEILRSFVDASTQPGVPVSFGVSSGLIQQIIQFALSNSMGEHSEFLFSVLAQTMQRVNDFCSSTLSFLSHNWNSLSTLEQQNTVSLLHSLVSSNEILNCEILSFISLLVQWMGENILLSNADKLTEEKIQLGEHITKLIRSLSTIEKAWKILLPQVGELAGATQQSTQWVIDNALCISQVEQSASPDSCQTYIESIGISRLLSIMDCANHSPEILSFVSHLKQNTKQLHSNVLDQHGGTEQYQQLLVQLLESEDTEPNNANGPSQFKILLEQCSLILWAMAKITPLHLLQQYARLPILSLIAKIFATEKASSLHALGLLAFSNVLQKIPKSLSEVPETFFDMPKMVELLYKHPESVPAVCRLVLQLFQDPRFQKEFISADGFFQLGKAIEELSIHIQSSEIARESLCEALAILVFSAQIPALRMEIIGDALIPCVLNLLNITRVEQIIKNVLLFINYMSSEPIARREIIDTRDIDTLSAIIDQTETYPELSKSAKECYIRLGGLTTLCRVATDPEPGYQEFYRCRTCGLNDGICINCAEVCHRGHGLSSVQSGTMICTCGISPNCLIKERPNLRVQVPLQICSFAFTGPHYTTQAWFFCRTCFRNEQKGVCTICAYVCHKGHDVRFGSEGRFYCDCSDRYGVSCKCAQHVVVNPDSLPRFRKPRHITVVNDENEEEDDDSADDDSCIVCMDQPKDALFYKCGHIAACMDCACMLKQRNDPCVICRESIDAVVRTFFV